MKKSNEFRLPSESTEDNVPMKAQTNDPADIATEREAPRASSSGDERHRMIAEAAYYRALSRGLMPGREVDDWTQAEAEIDRVFTRE